MIRLLLSLLVAVLVSGHADAQQKQFKKTFSNINYVPCENMGITASGAVDVTVNYMYLPAVPPSNPTGAAPAMQIINSVFVTPNYTHENDPSGTLTMPDVIGGTIRVMRRAMQKP